MKTVIHLLLFIFFSTGFFSNLVISSFSDFNFDKFDSVPVAESVSASSISYDRINEVKKKCKSVLSSASDLKLESISRSRRTKRVLGLQYGDWVQESGNSPILPFNSEKSLTNSSSKPLNLASFWVTDLDLPHRTKKYIAINGVLLLAITTYHELPNEVPNGFREFEMWPSHTQIKITFQGIYTENDEEKVMCLLGETMLPSREADDSSTKPWKWVQEHPSETPPLLQDDQILLILRYPKRFTLRNRVIQGELTSLNQESNLKFFNKIHLLSQLGKSSRYEFDSEEELVSKACDPYPYKNDSFLNSGIEIFKGKGFCDLFQRLTYSSSLTIVPNWKCNGTDEYCRKLGPFGSNEEISSTDGSFKGVKLYIQDLHCEETAARSEIDVITKVSAVFRAVDPKENPYIGGLRSALNNMTITAEGIWRKSSGQLCMIGCHGNDCNVRVCLYIPASFSIQQRSILTGTFFCLNTEKNLTPNFFPLSFEKLLEPMDMQNYFQTSKPVYSYSKIDEAGVILEKVEPFSFQTLIKKSFLEFPKLEDSSDYLSSLSLLAEDLTIHTSAFLDQSSKIRTSGMNLGFDILSFGPLFGVFWRLGNVSIAEEQIPYHTKAEYTEKQLLLNISAQISFTGEDFGNFSVLYLEGLYDEHVGKMFLAGCRDVRASWKILSESNDLESGLDCLIDVMISYPPVNSRWLADQSAKLSISSRRSEDDPLYFKPLKIKTYPIFYRKQREDILSRAGIEGILRVLTLTFAICCITSQIFYIRSNTDSVPFMSLVSLGVQALGYSLHLITGAETLFKTKASTSSSYDLQRNQWFNVIDYIVKLLVLICFLLISRLSQKVWKSRTRLLTRTPRESLPSDRRVVFVTLILYTLGYILALFLHPARTDQMNTNSEGFGVIGGNFGSKTNWWQTETEEYIGLIQDFFLLPQVIGNLMWQIDCRPLRKLYYVGITMVRLFPHFYDYICGSVPDPYFIVEEHEFVNPNFDFFNKFGDIGIPVTAMLLAVLVFVQQRWSYGRLFKAVSFRRFRLLPSPSVKYERLESLPTESELVSGVCGNGNRVNAQD